MHEDAAEAGRATSAERVRDLLDGSFLTDPARERAVQDELSFRCAPQVHGALADTAADLLDAVDGELAARPENPLSTRRPGTITPNGNFAPVGLALDLERARIAPRTSAASRNGASRCCRALSAPLAGCGRRRHPRPARLHRRRGPRRAPSWPPRR